MTEKRCPECTGKNVEEVDEGAYYCNDCGNEWLDPIPEGEYLLIDGFTHTVRTVEGDGGYLFVKEQLDQVTIDVAVRYVGGKAFDFWIDDEFRYKDLPPTAIACAWPDGEVLMGKVLVANRCGSHTTPLTEEDMRILYENIAIATLDSGEEIQVLIYSPRP